MTDQDQPIEVLRAPPRRRPDPRAPCRRRLYEKPRITFQEPLEGVAAVCVPPNGKAVAPCIVGSS